MYDQVCDYDPKSAEHPDLANTTYQTIRLSSQKLPTPESNPETVHVYEMFWADQSRLGNDWYQVLVGFYQMIFHVCSLGRDALDLAKEEFQSNCQWTLARRTHAVINFGLTLLAPVLNLCLLAVLLLVVPAKIPLGLQWIMAYGGIGVFAVGGWLAAMIHRNGRPHFNRMEWTMMAGGGLAALGVLIHVLIYKTVYWKTLAVEWVVVATVGVGYVLAIYSRSKPQVRLIGALCGLGTLALIGYELWICENSDVGIATAAIQSAVYVFLALEITWMAMALAVFVAMVAMYSGLDFSKSGRETRKTRALGTAFVSLMLPITLFVVVTIALYTPLLYLATPSDAKANAVSSAAKPPEPSKGVLSLPKDKLEAPLAKKLF